MAGHFGRVEADVVGATRSRVRAASAHAFDDGGKGDVDFQHVVKLDTRCAHGFGLRNGARKAVEQETVGAVGLRQAFLDQVDDQIVADQPAGGHHGLRLQAQGGAGLDCGTQHVAGGNLRNTEFLANKGGLRAFACTGCS